MVKRSRAHCIRNIDDELAKIKDKTLKLQLRAEICCIQLSFNQKIFDKLTELFEKKWRDSCQEFIDYFMTNWVHKKVDGTKNIHWATQAKVMQLNRRTK